jgi:hypothetical protein
MTVNTWHVFTSNSREVGNFERQSHSLIFDWFPSPFNFSLRTVPPTSLLSMSQQHQRWEKEDLKEVFLALKNGKTTKQITSQFADRRSETAVRSAIQRVKNMPEYATLLNGVLQQKEKKKTKKEE